MNYSNCITINTDASYSIQQKCGGYAFYIVCDSFKIQKSGYFKIHPENPMEAEMMCIANALHVLLHQKALPKTNFIIINSDCLNCFVRISKNSKDKLGRMIAKLIRQIREKTTIKGSLPKYEFRHVKAHNGTQDARSWVNDWCDKEAKKWMKIAVKIKLGK
jgi:ribonuclease HI